MVISQNYSFQKYIINTKASIRLSAFSGWFLGISGWLVLSFFLCNMWNKWCSDVTSLSGTSKYDDLTIASEVVRKALFQLLFCITIKNFCKIFIKLVCSVDFNWEKNLSFSSL